MLVWWNRSYFSSPIWLNWICHFPSHPKTWWCLSIVLLAVGWFQIMRCRCCYHVLWTRLLCQVRIILRSASFWGSFQQWPGECRWDSIRGWWDTSYVPDNVFLWSTRISFGRRRWAPLQIAASLSNYYNRVNHIKCEQRKRGYIKGVIIKAGKRSSS